MTDVGGLSPQQQHRAEEIYARLIQVIVDSEVEAIYEPHIVICRSRSTGVMGYTGPYPSGMAAVLAAEREAGLVADEDMDFSVAQLMDPIDPV